MPAQKEKQRGAIDILLILGIAVLLGVLPIAQELVGEWQESRGRAVAEPCTLSQANTWRCNSTNTGREQCQCWSGACGWGNSQNCPLGCTNGNCNQPPPACSIPDGQAGAYRCSDNNRCECKCQWGTCYWDCIPCTNGCSNNNCNNPPQPTATQTTAPIVPTNMPTRIPPTNTPVPSGCPNPDGSGVPGGYKDCLDSNTARECKWSAYGYYWYTASCSYGYSCSGGSCNPVSTLTPRPPTNTPALSGCNNPDGSGYVSGGYKRCLPDGKTLEECKWSSYGYYWDTTSCEHGCSDGSCKPAPTSTPAPSGCTNPSGSQGDIRCIDANILAICIYNYGVYYWNGSTCANGCFSEPSPRCYQPPTATPASVCSPGTKICLDAYTLKECVHAYGVNYWEQYPCGYGCSNNNCNPSPQVTNIEPTPTTGLATTYFNRQRDCDMACWISCSRSDSYWVCSAELPAASTPTPTPEFSWQRECDMACWTSCLRSGGGWSCPNLPPTATPTPICEFYNQYSCRRNCESICLRYGSCYTCPGMCFSPDDCTGPGRCRPACRDGICYWQPCPSPTISSGSFPGDECSEDIQCHANGRCNVSCYWESVFRARRCLYDPCLSPASTRFSPTPRASSIPSRQPTGSVTNQATATRIPTASLIPTTLLVPTEIPAGGLPTATLTPTPGEPQTFCFY